MTEIELPSLRDRLSSTLTGAQVLTVAGGLWAIYGSLSLQGGGEPWLAIGLILMAFCLLSAGFYLRTKVKQLPAVVASPALQKREVQAGRMFIIVNVIQGIAMFAAANVLINLKMAEYVAPVIALIVGLHFIPLAFSMRVPRHFGTRRIDVPAGSCHDAGSADVCRRTKLGSPIRFFVGHRCRFGKLRHFVERCDFASLECAKSDIS